jgi:sulfate/thiosulfate transport system substrate-binding protein
MNRRQFLAATSLAGASLSAFGGCMGPSVDFELLNVSYDPTRELYRKINRMFAERYKPDGKTVRVRQSHGGSGSQARSVIDGIPADIVTLAMWQDINNISAKGLISKDWEKGVKGKDGKLLGSLPYHSTIVFVVRKGNPFQIKDWPDLLKGDVKLITPNPKTSGGAKLILLAAWGAALKSPGGTERTARDFITEMYRRVPVLDTGARGATVTFARKNIGDVHLTWENEAWLEKRELKDAVEIIYPKWSVRAEPHVALVDANVDQKGTREAATEYLKFLFEPEAQEIIAETFFRPNDADVMKRHAGRFPSIELFSAQDIGLGNWKQIQQDVFAEGGMFDQIYQAGR